MSIQRMVVPLDALMDSRMGAMRQLHESWPMKVFKWGKGWYWNRFVDNFDHLFGAEGTAAWRSRYKNRDLTTLKVSFETNLVTEIREMVVGTEALIEKDPLVSGHAITVNFWPYQMSDADADKLLAVIKSRICPFLKDEHGNVTEEVAFDVPFDRVYLSPEELTIKRITDADIGWELAFIYDFAEWNLLHNKELDDPTCASPRNMIIFPALFLDKEPDKSDLTWGNGMPADPWQATTQCYISHVRLQFWPAYYFSIFKLSK